MSNVTSITDKIKESRDSELYESYLTVAKIRMTCYQAHIDAGFDHESAVVFTQLDTQPQLEEYEDEGEYTIMFEPDWEGPQ